MADKKVKYSIEAQDKTKAGVDSSIRGLLGIDDAVKKMGKSITDGLKITALIASFQQLAKYAFESVEAFGEFERTQIQLNTALGNNSTRIEEMNGLIETLSDKTLAGREDVMQMVSSLASLGKSESDIQKISTAAVNLSNVTGQGLNEAMKQVNATFSGSTDELGKLIPELKGLSKEQLAAGGAADIINQKLGLLSDQMSAGVSQKIKNMKDSWAELKIEFGKNLAETFSPIIGWIDKLAKGWTESLRTLRTYKEVQDSLRAGVAPSDIDPAQRMTYLAEEIRRAEMNRRAVIGGMTGGAQTPEQYSVMSGGDISVANALKFFEQLALNPEVARIDQSIAAWRDELRVLVRRAEYPAGSTGAGTTPAAPAASPYSEAFGTFMARMRESAEQWAVYNDLMSKSMSPAQIQEEMVKQFAVTSPSSPSGADWSRLNANNAAGTAGVPALYTDLLTQIFDNQEIIKAAQDAARQAEADAIAAVEAEKKKQEAILAYTTSANDRYLTAMAELFADRTSADYLRQELETEAFNAMTEARVNGMTDLSVLEDYYAQRRIALEVDISEMLLQQAKEAAEREAAAKQKAYDDAVKAAQGNGLRDLGQNDIGFKAYNVVQGAGDALSGMGGEGMGGAIMGGLGEALGGLAGPIGSIVGMISSLGPVMQILDPIGVILKGIMQVLTPIITQLLTPLLGMLTIIGRVIGGLLAPALQILIPIVEAVSLIFVWLYNKIVLPVYNAIMSVFNVIYNAFVDFINGILWLIDQIPFVDVGRVSKRDATEGFLEEINLADLSEAGQSVSDSGQSGSSASYTQGRTITMNFYNQSVVAGDAGIRQLAILLRGELMDLESIGQ